MRPPAPMPRADIANATMHRTTPPAPPINDPCTSFPFPSLRPCTNRTAHRPHRTPPAAIIHAGTVAESFQLPIAPRTPTTACHRCVRVKCAPDVVPGVVRQHSAQCTLHNVLHPPGTPERAMPCITNHFTARPRTTHRQPHVVLTWYSGGTQMVRSDGTIISSLSDHNCAHLTLYCGRRHHQSSGSPRTQCHHFLPAHLVCMLALGRRLRPLPPPFPAHHHHCPPNKTTCQRTNCCQLLPTTTADHV